MKSFSHPLTACVAVFLATAAIGWKLAVPDGAPAGEASPPAVRTKASQRNAGVEKREPRPEQEALGAVRVAGNPRERMAAAIRLAQTLPVSELAKWIEGDWFNLRDGYEPALFKQLAIHRWRSEDPEGYLRWILKSRSSESLDMLAGLAEDPQRALGFFRQHPDRVGELDTLGRIAKKDPALAWARFREILAAGIPAIDMQYCGKLMQEMAKQAPDALEGELATLPGVLRKLAEESLVRERLKASFADGMRSLWDHPDGWSLFSKAFTSTTQDGSAIFDSLGEMPASWRHGLVESFHSFSGRLDPKRWLAVDLEANGFSPRQADRIRSYALIQLAGDDPEAALSMLASQKEGFRSSPVIHAVFREAADDPEKGASLMALLTNEADRKYALETIDAVHRSANPVVVTQPDDWLDKAKSGSDYSLLGDLKGWDGDKMADLGRRFQSLPEQEKLAAARVLARADSYGLGGIATLQRDAIRLLMKNPQAAVPPQDEMSEPRGWDLRRSEGIESVASRHVVKWLQTDPQAAGDWVKTLPGGPGKQVVQRNLAENWAKFDPAAAKRWIDSLPDAERREITRSSPATDGK